MGDGRHEARTAMPSDRLDEGVDVLDHLIVLAKHKKLIAGVTLSATIVAAIISVLLPNIYTGIARILPPQQSQTTASMMLGQLGGLAGLAGTSLGIKNPNDLYVGLLGSRTVSDSIIEKFALRKLYDKSTMSETRIQLAHNSNFVSGKDGFITVEFSDEDPQRAAAIANAFVEELQKLTQSLAVTEAAQRRLFFEGQLLQAKRDLANAEIALKLTQEKTGLIILDEQGRAIIESVATLRAQIAAKEVQLRAMRTFTTNQNPDYVRAQQQLNGLRSELEKLEHAQFSKSGDILLSSGKVPEAGLEYVRRVRDVKYHETIFELLARQLEVAKIDEAKDAAIVQIVDLAVPPDRKSKPSRSTIVLVVALIAAFASIILAFARETWERVSEDPTKADQLTALRSYALPWRVRR